MSIRRKVFVIILVLFAFLGGADFLIKRYIIFPSFLTLEYREAGENLRRIFHSIDREIVHLDQLCRDWAVWNDAYTFMEQQPEDFIKSNLNPETQTAARLNLLLFLRPDGTILWKRGLDSSYQTPLNFQLATQSRLATDHPFLTVSSSAALESTTSGVIDSEFGPLLFSSQRILRSDGSGPTRGFLVMGRFLDQSTVRVLQEQTRIPFTVIYPIPDQAKLCQPLDQVPPVIQDQFSFLDFNNGKFIKSCAGYPDVSGKPVFGIQYLFPREITRQGITSMGYAAALVVGFGVIVLIILNLLLQHIILKPIQRLTEHALTIEQEKDFSKRLDLNRSDEIGRLAFSLDTMVQTIDERTRELQLANEQLIILTVQDGLTGIANRRLFDSYLNKEWRRAMREQMPLSLILLDVDFFKHYNDAYGHLQGDRCLVALAETLQRHIRRPGDLAARYGGEEFAVILPNTPEQGAILMAERIREGILALEMVHCGSNIASVVTVSLGVVTTVPDYNSNNQWLDLFVETADRGLYQAKEQGRNRTVYVRMPKSPAV